MLSCKPLGAETLPAHNTQKYDAQSNVERIPKSSRDSLNASAHGNGFVMSSLQHCVLLRDVPQPESELSYDDGFNSKGAIAS